MLAWVTSGLIAPGVQCGSGSEFRPEPRAWQEPGGGWGWTTALLAALTGSRPPLRTALLTPSAAAGLETCGATLLDAPPQPASRTRQMRLSRAELTVQLCQGQAQRGRLDLAQAPDIDEHRDQRRAWVDLPVAAILREVKGPAIRAQIQVPERLDVLIDVDPGAIV